jgi:ribonuclease Z
MKLVFLGTSAAQPTENRGLSCICLEKDGEILMFDAGEAAQISFMKSGLGWNKKMKLFVTHMHGDHCVGILGLLQTMSMQNRTETLEIFGPKGIEEFIAANIKILNFGLSFPILITTIKEGKIFEDEKFSMYVCKANHSVTAFSYLFEEKDKPGRFNLDKAKQLEIPEGKLWSELQKGNEIIINQKIIKPEQVLGEKRPGKKIGISGDTMPTQELEKFFEDCDYLVFDSTFLDEEKLRAQETCHSKMLKLKI